MKARKLYPLLVAVAALLMLVACGKSTGPNAGDASAGRASASGPLKEHVSTARYTIDITYPPLSPEADVLDSAIRRRAETIRYAFLNTLPDPGTRPAGESGRMHLKIEFSVASRTSTFVSVREKGLMDNGGAHPIPLIGTYVFDMNTKKLLTLDDLFNDPVKTRTMLAAFARKALYAKLLDKVPGGNKAPPKARRVWQANMRGMIDPGTRPTAKNFSHFLIDSGSLDRSMSLTLVFPPYQVAPYVYGVQTVDVPLKVFAADLKPQYRPAFGLVH